MRGEGEEGKRKRVALTCDHQISFKKLIYTVDEYIIFYL